MDDDKATIFAFDANICNGQSKEAIGYFTGYILPVSTLELSGQDFFEICDGYDQTLHDFAYDLLQRAKLEPLDVCPDGSLLYASLLELQPTWAGHGIGIAAFKALLKAASERLGARTCLFEPMPLQFSRKLDLRDKSIPIAVRQEFKAAKEKLTQLYIRELGAEKLSARSHHYLVSLGSE